MMSCNKEGAPADKGAPPPSAGPKLSPFAAFESGKSLDGVWLVGQNDFSGAAWNIQGKTVTTWDGKAEKKAELSVDAPCELGMVDGGMTSGYQYAWDGDTLYAGLGAVGIKKGSDAIVCGLFLSTIFLVQGGKCQECKESMTPEGGWTCEPGDCTLGADKFVASSEFMGNIERKELEVVGNLILSDQMKGNRAERVQDMAAAKAALAKRPGIPASE